MEDEGEGLSRVTSRFRACRLEGWWCHSLEEETVKGSQF